MSRHTRAFLAALTTLGLAACSETSIAPNQPLSSSESADLSKAKLWEANASVNWTDRATALTAHAPVSVTRLYVYLSLAQLRAGEDAHAIRPHPPIGAAIGAASAVVLKAFFPAFGAEIDAALAAQASAPAWRGATHADFEAGAALGRAAAARVLAYAADDRIGLANPGTPPTTPGSWLWNGGPMSRGGYRARPFFIESGLELLPPPPPAYGSAEFLAALAEVRRISDSRTPEQLDIARYWNTAQSPTSDAGRINMAVELLRAYRRSDVESARILFLMNAATFDAVIGCFEAKYTYWYIRPPQADPMITLPIGLPPHPSYPAAHSCVSGASMGVLAAVFPKESHRVERLARESGLSRVYGGIHYRFDTEAGLALGRAAAAKAMAADLSHIAVR